MKSRPKYKDKTALTTLEEFFTLISSINIIYVRM
jgi:hypothetical protein